MKKIPSTPTNQHLPLFGDYTYKIVEAADLRAVIQQHYDKVFGPTFRLDIDAMLSDIEKEQLLQLRQNMVNLFRLRILVYHQEEVIGWSFGRQDFIETYYMTNTGILPTYQNKGIYTALLPNILEILGRQGFQVVNSRHTATNNAVIVPKLKAGFVIKSLEISDYFGTLVHLAYYFNATRRQAMDLRAGQTPPNKENNLMSYFPKNN